MWAERKSKWKSVLLSVPASFNEIPQSDLWKTAWNKRQAVVQQHESLSRTALQSAMEVAQLKALIESGSNDKKLTPSQLSSALLAAGLQQVVSGSAKAKKGEDEDSGTLSANFISSALSVQRAVLSSPRCVELLLDLEASFGTQSPFHMMSKMACLASKPTSAKTREWILSCVHDWVMHGVMAPSEITKGSLSGGKHHVGIIQLCECKLKVSSLQRRGGRNELPVPVVMIILGLYTVVSTEFLNWYKNIRIINETWYRSA